jgi:hypothetical protein
MAGYSGTQLVKKLGIKLGMRLYIKNPPIAYPDLVAGLPVGIFWLQDLTPGLDFIHAFYTHPGDLALDFPLFQQSLAPTGMVWISWPKRGSGMASELNENIIRDMGLACGLVDVKVCAVDETWSGLKFVIRLKDRS